MKGNFMIKKRKLIFAAVSIIVSAVYLYRQKNRLELSEYAIKTRKLPTAFDGFKIVQIADLHNKRFGKENRRLIKLIKAQKPDIIVISGDLIDSRHTHMEAALEFIRSAVEIADVFYTTGNHEHRLESPVLTAFFNEMKSAGAIVLEDETVSIEHCGERIYISGMSDRPKPTKESLENLLAPAKDGLSILIAHRPHNAPIYASAGADIAFSGHAHGGLIRLPFIGGIIAPNQGFFPKYSEGVHYFGDKAVVISRGLGSSLCPIRINNRPEVVALTLSSSK